MQLLVLSSPSPSYTVQDTQPRVVQLIVRMGLPTSRNITKTIPYRHTQDVSQVTLEFVNLTINMDHHEK